jgi:hypothetical protein
MLFAENQHISKPQNTAFAQIGPKATGHPNQRTGPAAQNRVTFSQLSWAHYITPSALYFFKAPICPRNFKNRRNEPNLPACRGAPLSPTNRAARLLRSTGIAVAAHEPPFQSCAGSCRARSARCDPARSFCALRNVAQNPKRSCELS